MQSKGSLLNEYNLVSVTNYDIGSGISLMQSSGKNLADTHSPSILKFWRSSIPTLQPHKK